MVHVIEVPTLPEHGVERVLGVRRVRPRHRPPHLVNRRALRLRGVGNDSKETRED
jgi:hypothetical protein